MIGLYRCRPDRRLVSRILAAVAVVLLATVGVQAAPAGSAAATLGYTQLLVVSNFENNVSHAVRPADGVWTGFGDVEGQSGELGQVFDTAGVLISGVLHTLVIPQDGDLRYAARRTDGSWTSFANLEAGNARQIGTVNDVAAANVAGILNVLVTTSDGRLFQTARSIFGTWQPFRDVKLAAGDPGFITDVTAAGFANGTLQVAVAASGGVFHTIRTASGTWQPFTDVKRAAGDPGRVTALSGAVAGTAFQLLVATSDGGLFHTIRGVFGGWQSFVNVKGVAGDPGPVSDVGAAGFTSTTFMNGQLHVACVAGGGIFYTIRAVDGSWQAFSDVRNVAGDPGFSTAVSLAAS
jgi:hypothetical protein